MGTHCNENKLIGYMKVNHLDGFFIAKPENVRYISGYTGDDAFLLITASDNYFLTDPRYTQQAALECPDYRIVNWRRPKQTIADALQQVVHEKQLHNIAFETDTLSYRAYLDMQRKVKAESIATAGVIEAFRSIKSEEEIQCASAACAIASRAFNKLLPDIHVGLTEKELASRLSHAMVMAGADTQPYGNILISGKRTSLLHGIPSAKSIEYGDLVLLDFGCAYRGYLSDMTRTVVVGKASAKVKEIYRTVDAMLKAGLAAMKAGAPAADIYRAVKQVVAPTEYASYAYTGIGHGVGLFVHEKPFISPFSEDVLQAGNVMTIEPGLYIPGWGGVRIEDQVLITNDGYVDLVSAPKELIEL